MAKFIPGSYITVFADASYCHKTRSTGYACWIKHGLDGRTERFSGNVDNLRNSTEAELHALITALEYVKNFIDYEDKNISVQSDCIPALDRLRKRVGSVIPSGYQHISFKHVRGHQNSINARSAVNEWCDRTAKERMIELRGY